MCISAAYKRSYAHLVDGTSVERLEGTYHICEYSVWEKNHRAYVELMCMLLGTAAAAGSLQCRLCVVNTVETRLAAVQGMEDKGGCA